MNRADFGGVRLGTFHLARSGFRCRVCGKVHVRKKMELAGWLLLLFLISFTLRPPEKLPRRNTAGKPSIDRIFPKKESIRTGGYRMSGAGDRTEPGHHSVPETAVVWNREGGGVFLWDQPDGTIIGFLANGTWVILQDRWAAAGNVPFGEVGGDSGAGWLDMRKVHRLAVPEAPLSGIRADFGVFLYDRPSGIGLVWLSPGTPVLPDDSFQEGGWTRVRLLVGGETGVLPPGSLQP